MRRQARPRTRPATIGLRPGLARGFTLIELLIVMLIIGILIAFIMSAAMDGVRRAEERSTQALIAKLDAGMSDRVDAILATRADAFPAHQFIAGVWANAGGWMPQPPYNIQPPFGLVTAPAIPNPVVSNNRAQILARFDQVKAELPDVFFLQGDANYPLNFLANSFSFGSALPTNSNYAAYLLPLGIGLWNDPAGVIAGSPSFGSYPPMQFPYTIIPAAGVNPASLAFVSINATDMSTGIFGASYTAAGSVYKGLFDAVQRNNPGIGTPSPANAGFDGVDNNNNGMVDELSENDIGLASGKISSQMIALLKQHTHKTARSEMLYALLVEGQGPFGSVFSPDDFRDLEVRDTDGDGLYEFIDSWGEPLQYYRWPICFQSDTQRGAGPYRSVFDTRDQDTLDPNQTLVDPAWWSGSTNANSPFGSMPSLNPGTLSGGGSFFQQFFHILTDPNSSSVASAPAGATWDRGSTTSPFHCRREFYSRYLILSAGPDKIPGVPVLDPLYYTAIDGSGYANPTTATSVAFTGGPAITQGVATSSTTFQANLLNLQVEEQAAQATPFNPGGTASRASDPIFFTFPGVYPVYPFQPADVISEAIREAGNDDVTNHNINAPGGATQ